MIHGKSNWAESINLNGIMGLVDWVVVLLLLRQLFFPSLVSFGISIFISISVMIGLICKCVHEMYGCVWKHCLTTNSISIYMPNSVLFPDSIRKVFGIENMQTAFDFSRHFSFGRRCHAEPSFDTYTPIWVFFLFFLLCDLCWCVWCH